MRSFTHIRLVSFNESPISHARGVAVNLVSFNEIDFLIQEAGRKAGLTGRGPFNDMYRKRTDTGRGQGKGNFSLVLLIGREPGSRMFFLCFARNVDVR